MPAGSAAKNAAPARVPLVNVNTPSGIPHKVHRGKLPRQSDEGFDRQRFDNFTSWLDVQSRAMERSKQQFFGEKPDFSKPPRYGFSDPLEKYHNPNPQGVNPLRIQEASMTSGMIVNRNYDLNHRVVGVNDKFDAERSCPHHGPNYLEVTDKMFWEDRRSGSRNPDFIYNYDKFPKRHRPIDKELRCAVPDVMVKNWVRSMSGEGTMLSEEDKRGGAFRALFRDELEIRPKAHHIRELNLDHSVIGLPGGLKEEKAELDMAKRPLVKVIGEDSFIADDDKLKAAANPETIPPELKQLMGLNDQHAPEPQKPGPGPEEIYDPESKIIGNMSPKAEQHAQEKRFRKTSPSRFTGFDKPPPRPPVQGWNISTISKEILTRSSTLPAFMRKEGKPKPAKTFVHNKVETDWDVTKHRTRMRYPGGQDALDGTAGTWSADHEGGPGIGLFAAPPQPIAYSIFPDKK